MCVECAAVGGRTQQVLRQQGSAAVVGCRHRSRASSISAIRCANGARDRAGGTHTLTRRLGQGGGELEGSIQVKTVESHWRPYGRRRCRCADWNPTTCHLQVGAPVARPRLASKMPATAPPNFEQLTTGTSPRRLGPPPAATSSQQPSHRGARSRMASESLQGHVTPDLAGPPTQAGHWHYPDSAKAYPAPLPPRDRCVCCAAGLDRGSRS